jgi:hypothetical protein
MIDCDKLIVTKVIIAFVFANLFQIIAWKIYICGGEAALVFWRRMSDSWYGCRAVCG